MPTSPHQIPGLGCTHLHNPWDCKCDEHYSCDVMLYGTVDMKKERLCRWTSSNHMHPLGLDLEVRDMERQRYEITETFSHCPWRSDCPVLERVTCQGMVDNVWDWPLGQQRARTRLGQQPGSGFFLRASWQELSPANTLRSAMGDTEQDPGLCAEPWHTVTVR